MIFAKIFLDLLSLVRDHLRFCWGGSKKKKTTVLKSCVNEAESKVHIFAVTFTVCSDIPWTCRVIRYKCICNDTISHIGFILQSV